MTEKLFTGTLNHNQNKTKQLHFERVLFLSKLINQLFYIQFYVSNRPIYSAYMTSFKNTDTVRIDDNSKIILPGLHKNYVVCFHKDKNDFKELSECCCFMVK